MGQRYLQPGRIELVPLQLQVIGEFGQGDCPPLIAQRNHQLVSKFIDREVFAFHKRQLQPRQIAILLLPELEGVSSYSTD